jgi:hypothetical protein
MVIKIKLSVLLTMLEHSSNGSLLWKYNKSSIN